MPSQRLQLKKTKKKLIKANNQKDASAIFLKINSQRLSGVMVVLGIIIIISGNLIFNRPSQNPVFLPIPAEQTRLIEPELFPSHISISSVIDIPVIEGDYVNGEWTDTRESAVYYIGSATPFTGGNTIIYAHNNRNLFGRLKEVQEGDIVDVKLSSGLNRHYRVAQIQTLEESETEPLYPTDHEQLTLYTCTGFLDKQRLVVTAVPISGQEAESGLRE